MIEEFTEEPIGWAQFSDDLKLRYRLRRMLTPPGGQSLAFIMLNPSTATAGQNDPTVRRCIAFAAAWGFHMLEVVNIFPLRSTDPDMLYDWTRRLSGQEWSDIHAANSRAIIDASRDAKMAVAAWGAHGKHLLQGTAVRALCHENGVKLHHLGLNKDGSPKHPLYIKGGTVPVEWTL